MPTATHDHHILDTDIPIFRPIDGLFSERQLSEILYSLEGQGGFPTKYVYIGKGVNHWMTRSINSKEDLAICSNSNTDSTGSQYKMMSDTIDLVLGAVQNKNLINFVDIGCGTGFPVYEILSYLKDKKQLNKYIAIDIVPQMIDLAITNLTSTGVLEKIKAERYIHDFEDGHFADFMIKHRKDRVINLFSFIGGTLSNMVDRHRALANIRDSMTEGDLLWTGAVLHNCGSQLLDIYDKLEINSPEYMRRHKHHAAVLESFGMTNWHEYGKIVVKEVDNFGLLKYYFVVEKPFELEFPITKDHKPIKLTYYPEEKISLFQLKNYEESDLVSEIKEAGFKMKMMNINDFYDSALILASV